MIRFVTLAVLLATPCLWGQNSPAASPGPLIDLKEAVQRAQAYNPQLLSSGIGASLAQEGRKQAKSALLPTVGVLNQYAFTQPNGTDSGIFIANNGVHEFAEQGTSHAEFSYVKRAEYQRSIAAELTARARVDVAARGLVLTVAQYYYAAVLVQRKLVNARNSLQEAQRFEELTRQQEQGGEVSHADVIKAQLQRAQRQRDVVEGETDVEKAKVALAVLMMPDFTQPYTVVDDLVQDAALLTGSEVHALGLTNNPNIRTAESAIAEAQFGVKAAHAEALPILTLDYFFGIDANNLARRNPAGQNMLGSNVIATVTIPIFNWGSTRSKIRQAELQQRQAELDLSQTRREVQAGLESYYLETRAAQAQLASLRQTVEMAAESLRLTLLRYQGGEATALEVVDAQATAALARDGYDAGLARHRVAVVGLQVLTGTF